MNDLGLGDVLYMPATLVTVEGGTGGVAKGDPVKIEGASALTGIYIKVIAQSALEDAVIGVAMEVIAEGKLGTIMIASPVVFLTGKATVTIGAWVGFGASGQVSDVVFDVGAVLAINCIGIAWKGVATTTDVIPVQLMPCVFLRTTT